MQISILSTSKTQPPGKNYFVLEVAYKDNTSGKVSSKKVFSFGAAKAAFDTLVNSKPGDVFEINSVKNPNTGYFDWISASQAAPGLAPTASAPVTPVKSQYETPDERAARQVSIVRQSSLNYAVNTLTAGAKTPPSVEQVLALAAQYVAWVNNTDAEIADMFDAPNDLEVS